MHSGMKYSSTRNVAAAPVLGRSTTLEVGDPDIPRIGLVLLAVLALVTGTITGFGAVVFRDLIGFIHNALFVHQFSFRYDANLFTPTSAWGAGVILIPVLGSLVVTFLVTQFAPEARGHGVPEAMDAIYYKSGIIRPVVALVSRWHRLSLSEVEQPSDAKARSSKSARRSGQH